MIRKLKNLLSAALLLPLCAATAFAAGSQIKKAEDVVVNFIVRKENEPTVACAELTNGAFTVGVAGGGHGVTRPTDAFETNASTGIGNLATATIK